MVGGNGSVGDLFVSVVIVDDTSALVDPKKYEGKVKNVNRE